MNRSWLGVGFFTDDGKATFWLRVGIGIDRSTRVANCELIKWMLECDFIEGDRCRVSLSDAGSEYSRGAYVHRSRFVGRLGKRLASVGILVGRSVLDAFRQRNFILLIIAAFARDSERWGVLLTLNGVLWNSDVDAHDVARPKPVGAVPLRQLTPRLDVSAEHELSPDDGPFRRARFAEEDVRRPVVRNLVRTRVGHEL